MMAIAAAKINRGIKINQILHVNSAVNLHSFMVFDLAGIDLARFYQLVQKSLGNYDGLLEEKGLGAKKKEKAGDWI